MCQFYTNTKAINMGESWKKLGDPSRTKINVLNITPGSAVNRC